MASFSPTQTTTSTTTTKSLSAVPVNPLLSKSSQLSAYRTTKTNHVATKISCNASNNNRTNKVDRRNMLIGLGGLYGAATLSSEQPTLAAPTAPDATQCGPSRLDDNSALDCCPPKPSQFPDFKLPDTKILRIRPAAQLVDDKFLEKYSKALALMKALPDSDPRSFSQQADIHCAYCNGGYHQVGLPDLELQVHNSWLFFPFHRAYLYFYEKILGKLIDDPTFALPYWNWDHPDGMVMPSWFNDPKSPFYDAIRDPLHLPPTPMDLSYDGPGVGSNLPPDQLIKFNLTIMYRQMVSNAKKPSLFLGDPYRVGDEPNPGPGSLETQPHGTVHSWTGNPKPATPMWEDMGNFYSAARDPIFYAHHANVDRTWSIWRTLSPKNKNFKDKDFLNAAFFFFDENAKPVKIYVRDCLDTKKLGYDYQPMDLPWLKARPTPRRSKVLKKVLTPVKNALAAEVDVPTVVWPKQLDHIIRTHLTRRRKSRSKREKDDEEEILVIDIESNKGVYTKFDVFVNDEDERPTRENRARTEYAGSFVNVPHRFRKGEGKEGDLLKTRLKLGLTDLIEDLGIDDDEGIDVILVPRAGCESMVIKDVRIEFITE